MGTRGVFGFHKNGVDKITYNHYDSYPEELGVSMLEFCQKYTAEEMKKIFDRITMVELGSTPTAKQQVECEKYMDLRVSEQSPDDWYCLLREAQGSLEPWAEGLKYMIDSKDFLKDSLFCEWGYVINLTEETLEVYRGFQTTPQNNRYKIDKPFDSKYYNCKLLHTSKLENLKGITAEQFVAGIFSSLSKDETGAE